MSNPISSRGGWEDHEEPDLGALRRSIFESTCDMLLIEVGRLANSEDLSYRNNPHMTHRLRMEAAAAALYRSLGKLGPSESRRGFTASRELVDSSSQTLEAQAAEYLYERGLLSREHLEDDYLYLVNAL